MGSSQYEADQTRGWVTQDVGRASERAFGSQTAWYLGLHDRAIQWSTEAVDLGRKSNQPYDLAYALGFAGMFHWFRREPQRALELAMRRN